MPASNRDQAKRVISNLRLQEYADRAVRRGTLRLSQTTDALLEYRHHLLLIWINQTMSNQEMIVPTERADAIWHEHLRDRPSYLRLCMDLVGREIKHVEGLAKGTHAHTRAVEHTRSVSREYASRDNGFVSSNYLASCGGFIVMPVYTDHGRHDGHSNHNDSSHSSHDHGHHGGGHDSGSHSGGDSGSSGSSCGGGGGGCGGS